jgi:hypothetical protein
MYPETRGGTGSRHGAGARCAALCADERLPRVDGGWLDVRMPEVFLHRASPRTSITHSTSLEPTPQAVSPS